MSEEGDMSPRVQVGALYRECQKLRERLEKAEALLGDSEPTVWAECACEPKKPDWWEGDQWELRPYEERAAERERRCRFHANYDDYLAERES